MAKKSSSVAEAAATLGHRGGLKGGPARAKALTKAARVAIARKGGHARHGKHVGGEVSKKQK